jgi:DNA-binding CsgD family transcriptional regulator/GAF domain-containing protein
LNSAQIVELSTLLAELQQLERELVEQRYVRRTDGRERTLEALARLAEIGSPEGLIDRAALELGASSDFDLVLISRYQTPRLVPLGCFAGGGEELAAAIRGELAARPPMLSYPLVEQEVVQRHEAVAVDLSREGPRASPALAEVCGWRSYVVAPIVLEGSTAGLLHASRAPQQRGTDEIDLEIVALFAEGFARAFERTTLKAQLRRQKLNLQSAARWINAHVVELSAAESFSAPASAMTGAETLERLTPRELDVIALLAQGMSNREIGDALVLGDGTVKYHVKNILRKLHAHSRSEAITIYAGAQGARRR